MNEFTTVALFIVASAAVFTLLSALSRGKPRERRGLEGLEGNRGGTIVTAAPAASTRESLRQASRQWRRYDAYRSLERALERAGFRLTPLEFIVIACGAAIVGAALAGFLTRSYWWAAATAGVLAVLAPVVMELARLRRLARFEASLPEALELMAASLRSGQGFQRALQVTAEDMPSPVKEEFGMAVQDISVGHTVEDALHAVWMRVPSYEMELITTAIAIQLQVGGNLSEILQKIADTLRERARIRGEIATLTAEGKLSAVLVFCIPILLFFWMKSTNPAYMAPLLTSDLGRLMLVVAAISECVGMLIIWKMVSMEV
jgi:tight adherence protein B